MSATFLRRIPALHHVADRTAIPLIRRYGLLSAERLVHLFAVPPHRHAALLQENRDNYEILTHPMHGTAWLRRQQMRDEPLRSRLHPGIGLREWRRFINGLVFLSPSLAAAERLRGAEPGRDQVVLRWRTADVLGAGLPVLWCRFNNGYIDRSGPANRRLRAREDYRDAAALGPADPVVEAVVPSGLPPTLAFAVCGEEPAAFAGIDDHTPIRHTPPAPASGRCGGTSP